MPSRRGGEGRSTMFEARRTWVLGGGGARGAAQVGVLQALFEAGVDPPVSLVGTSVGALNGSAIAAYPSLAGTMMLREVWMSRQAIEVFRAHPLGMILSGLKRDQVSAFPQQNIRRLIQRAQALTAIPGLFPSVRIGDREHLDGGVVDNTPLNVAVDDGAKEILAISLMGGGEYDVVPTSLPELIARTLQLSLHHQMLADYEQLRGRARIVVLCPVTVPTATWEMKREHLDAVMEASRVATAALLSKRGSKLFRHSGIHYLELQ